MRSPAARPCLSLARCCHATPRAAILPCLVFHHQHALIRVKPCRNPRAFAATHLSPDPDRPPGIFFPNFFPWQSSCHHVRPRWENSRDPIRSPGPESPDAGRKYTMIDGDAAHVAGRRGGDPIRSLSFVRPASRSAGRAGGRRCCREPAAAAASKRACRGAGESNAGRSCRASSAPQPARPAGPSAWLSFSATHSPSMRRV